MAQSKASLNSIYTEIRTLRHEVELIRTALIPEEKVSDRELAEILDIDKKMRRGETMASVYRWKKTPLFK